MLTEPRKFVESGIYRGSDRRRRKRTFQGPERRRDDEPAAESAGPSRDDDLGPIDNEDDTEGYVWDDR